MLIRSQDRMKIKQLNSCIEIYLIGSMVNIDGSTFGEYSTQEKAIKVLDRICDFYEEHMEEISCDQEPFVRAVFYMPQDDYIY